MITGRDLIIYILQNGLENEAVFENGRLLGFMNVAEAAIKFGVGGSTIDTWIKMGLLDSIRIGNLTFIPANATNPKERINDERNNNDVGSERINNEHSIATAGNADLAASTPTRYRFRNHSC